MRTSCCGRSNAKATTRREGLPGTSSQKGIGCGTDSGMRSQTTCFRRDVHRADLPGTLVAWGSSVFLDLDNTQNGVEIQVAVILRGCKRFKQ